MIIGITGPAGAGKSTVAAYLVENYGFTELSWARPLKQMLRVIGFDEPATRAEKEAPIPGFDFSYRQAAQKLGTEFGRALDPDLWIKIVGRQVQDHPEVNWVISDVRFENEADLVRKLGGQVWHIAGRKADLGEAAGHASEAGVLFYPAEDELLDNREGHAELRAQVDKLMGAAQ